MSVGCSLLQLLPTDPRAAERNLSAVEQELKEMDKQYRHITSHAKRWPRRWLVLGCTALAAQVRLPAAAADDASMQ